MTSCICAIKFRPLSILKPALGYPVSEFIDPVFTKTSPKRSFSVIQNERFGLVFAKTGSIISGTGLVQRWAAGRDIEHGAAITAALRTNHLATGTPTLSELRRTYLATVPALPMHQKSQNFFSNSLTFFISFSEFQNYSVEN
jgi:hypothetical protein